jgi:hypothetical protein
MPFEIVIAGVTLSAKLVREKSDAMPPMPYDASSRAHGKRPVRFRRRQFDIETY